jgi:hypothetical protein
MAMHMQCPGVAIMIMNVIPISDTIFLRRGDFPARRRYATLKVLVRMQMLVQMGVAVARDPMDMLMVMGVAMGVLVLIFLSMYFFIFHGPLSYYHMILPVTIFHSLPAQAPTDTRP